MRAALPLRMDPETRAAVYLQLGSAVAAQRRFDEGIPLILRSLEIDPSIQTADGIDALASVDELHDVRTSTLVLRGRYDAERLVQRDVPEADLPCRLTIHLDTRVGCHLRAQDADDLPIDAHAAGRDELLGSAAGRDPALRHHLLETRELGHGAVTLSGSVSTRGSSSRLVRPKHSRNSQVVP